MKLCQNTRTIHGLLFQKLVVLAFGLEAAAGEGRRQHLAHTWARGRAVAEPGTHGPRPRVQKRTLPQPGRAPKAFCQSAALRRHTPGPTFTVFVTLVCQSADGGGV